MGETEPTQKMDMEALYPERAKDMTKSKAQSSREHFAYFQQ